MASWDEEITLINSTDEVDAEGFPVGNSGQPVSLLANELPVNASNFYGGAQVGFTISKVFEIHAIEYDGQDQLSYEGEPYRIRRTRKANGFTELHCERFDTDHE